MLKKSRSSDLACRGDAALLTLKDGCGNKDVFYFQRYSRYTENYFRRSNPIFSTDYLQARLIPQESVFFVYLYLV